MKAAVLCNLNEPLNIMTDIEYSPPGRGQYWSNWHTAEMSQSIDGNAGASGAEYLPHLLGHEGSGKVVSVGEGVTKVSIGELVVLGWIKGKGLKAAGFSILAMVYRRKLMQVA